MLATGVQARVRLAVLTIGATLLLAGCGRPGDTVRVQTSFAVPTLSVTSPVSETPTHTVPPAAPADLRHYCHGGFVLAGVYSPGRLHVLNPCVAVTGTVVSTGIEHDGDLHISLTGVDQKWMSAGNLQRRDQAFVVEAVPDLPVTRPALGARVTVIGPWVLDVENGWNEIHPAWAVIAG
jgi:hypothetical protein